MLTNGPSLNGSTAYACLRRAGVLAALLFLIVSCSYGVQFADTEGRYIYGDYSPMRRNISVILPSGESFSGGYYPLDRAELNARDGSLFVRTDVSTYLGLTAPAEGWHDLHAFLKGDRGTAMEIIFRYNGAQPAGYGVARTDKGDEYRVALGVGVRTPSEAPAPMRRPPGYYQ